jgi:hypothetical protein
MKKCKICQIEKPYEDFNVSKNSLDGRINKCKPCLKQYTTDLRNGKRMTKEEKNELLSISKVKAMEHEREITNNLLRVMGYQPDSLISIHEQFIVRHFVNKLITENI